MRGLGLMKNIGGMIVPVLALGALTAHGGTLLVANKSEASVTFFDTDSREARATLPTGDGPHEIAVSPDGTRALVTNYGTGATPGASLTVIDIVTPQVLKTIGLPAGARPHGVEWLDPLRAVVTAEGIASVLLVNIDEGEVESSVPVEQDVVHMLAIDADNRRVFTANIGSGTSSVLEIDAASKQRDITTGAGAEGVAVMAGKVWVSNRAADTVSVVDARSFETLQTLQIPGFPIRVEPDEERQRVYVTLPADDRLAIIDAQDYGVEFIDFELPIDTQRQTLLSDRIPNSSIPIGVLLSNDGHWLFVAHSAAHRVSIWKADTLEMVGSVVTGIEPDGMAWSPLASRR
jgi:DNA-binding beta-propeller fold protein YncE